MLRAAACVPGIGLYCTVSVRNIGTVTLNGFSIIWHVNNTNTAQDVLDVVLQSGGTTAFGVSAAYCNPKYALALHVTGRIACSSTQTCKNITALLLEECNLDVPF